MNHRQQQRKQRRIRGAADKKSRQKKGIHREKREIRQQTQRGAALREFGGPLVPPPVTLMQCRERSDDGGEQVQLAGACQRQGRCKNEQGKGSAKKASRGQRGYGWGCGSGGHGRSLILAPAIPAAAPRGWKDPQTDNAYETCRSPSKATRNLLFSWKRLALMRLARLFASGSKRGER